MGYDVEDDRDVDSCDAVNCGHVANVHNSGLMLTLLNRAKLDVGDDGDDGDDRNAKRLE